MTVMSSTILSLGSMAPDFALPDVVTGRIVTMACFIDKEALLVMFICRHCPYVKHVQAELSRLGADYADKGVGIVAISSNDATAFPEDGPESLKEMAKLSRFRFALCYDETQQVAKAYEAVCTPDFFLFDGERKLVYHGQFDDSRPGNGLPVTGMDLRAAIDAVLDGRELKRPQKPSMGCSIKWKHGNEPDVLRN